MKYLLAAILAAGAIVGTAAHGKDRPQKEVTLKDHVVACTRAETITDLVKNAKVRGRDGTARHVVGLVKRGDCKVLQPGTRLLVGEAHVTSGYVVVYAFPALLNPLFVLFTEIHI